MEKNLVAIGNSVGVVIDRGLCRMLEVKRGSRVRISSDGRRLLIEPVREEKKLTSLELVDAAATVEHLVYSSSIPERVLRRLHPSFETHPRPHTMAIAWASKLRHRIEPDDEVYARRFLAYHQQVRAGVGADAAADAALSCA